MKNAFFFHIPLSLWGLWAVCFIVVKSVSHWVNNLQGETISCLKVAQQLSTVSKLTVLDTDFPTLAHDIAVPQRAAHQDGHTGVGEPIMEEVTDGI